MAASARISGILCGAVVGAIWSGAAIGADSAACDSYQAAVTGGPMPGADSDTVVIRWLANANYEFAYKGKVYLFDAYFDRVSRNRDLGFKAAQVTKAEAIFVSHAHFDHISDIGPVARQTGAPVVGSPITAATAIKLGAPENQVVSVKGGETLKYGDATVEVALAQHSTIPPGLVEAYGALHKIETREDTPQERDVTADVRSRGTFDPDIITKGTLAFALIFPNGFKAVLVGSAGPITDGVRELAAKLGPVDVAIIAYQPHAVAERQIQDTWPFIELFKPKLFLPAHHDASFGVWLDLGLEPLFSKLRDERPETKFLAPLYRSPICVATSGPNRGAVISFKY
jgi:L-ascorbate metabolism protein UlaG (beta-lactamase superfamily)